jgi:hypothetical protein
MLSKIKATSVAELPPATPETGPNVSTALARAVK